MTLGVVIALLLQGGPSPAAAVVAPEVPADLPGCYALSLSEWQPKVALGADVEFITPPSKMELTTSRETRLEDRYYMLIKPAPGVTPSVHGWSFWSLSADNRLELTWSTGFSGLTMKLQRGSKGLVGTAHSAWDFSRTKQSATVDAVKVPCATEAR